LRTVAVAGKSQFKSWENPLEALDWMSRQFPYEDGRWIGHINYELGRLFEKLFAGGVTLVTDETPAGYQIVSQAIPIPADHVPVVIIDPVHGTRVERFSHKQAYHRRLIALEADLERDAWQMTRPPQFVPDVLPRSRERK
jgi:hypothetical protein